MKKEPENMDPRKDGDIYSAQMHFLFFEGLTKCYPDNSIQLAQAESYEVSEDNLIYTFHLKDTVWSNNTPVTAYDFEQSWKDILRSEYFSANAQLLSPIKNADAAKRGLASFDEVGIKAIDEKTLVIILEKPVPYLLTLLSSWALFPVNNANDRKKPNWADSPGPNFLCNGPYVLEKWDHGNQVIAASNPLYRKTQDLHPEKIVFTIVENNALTLQMFEQGLVDIIGDDLSGIPLEALPALEKKWTISHQPSHSTFLISINTDKEPLHHPKIRKALGLAINRQELIGSVGHGVVGTSVAYQASLAALNMIPPCLKENRYRVFFQDNDIDQAKVLLEEGMTELGIEKEAFESLVLNYPHRSYGAKESAQVIQKQWLGTVQK